MRNSLFEGRTLDYPTISGERFAVCASTGYCQAVSLVVMSRSDQVCDVAKSKFARNSREYSRRRKNDCAFPSEKSFVVLPQSIVHCPGGVDTRSEQKETTFLREKGRRKRANFFDSAAAGALCRSFPKIPFADSIPLLSLHFTSTSQKSLIE